ncbi:MAG: hypothetical protein AB7S75_23355 [Desulfococcaceae bacterium]
MEINNTAVDKNEETAGEYQVSDKPTRFDNVKNITAEKLHNAAEILYEKTALYQDAQSGMARYGKQASEWLDQSAEYVRQFEYEKADAGVREYVGQNPWRSMLIAGGVGLIIGSVLRRR